MIKRPETFEDILNLQKHLDKNLNNIRPRCLRDIKMSLIAECVEFNEETKESHKTWKTKEYNKSMELEELTDIYFFFAQMINFNDDTVNNYARIKHLVAVDFNGWQIKDYGSQVLPTLNLIANIINDSVLYSIDNLMEIAQKLGYTKKEYEKNWEGVELIWVIKF